MTLRDETYLAWVRKQPCVICSTTPCDAYHRIGHGRVGNVKVSDFETMPVCRLHHTELHAGWPKWEETHGDQRLFVLKTLLRAVEETFFASAKAQTNGRAEPLYIPRSEPIKPRMKSKLGGGRVKRESPTATPSKCIPRRAA